MNCHEQQWQLHDPGARRRSVLARAGRVLLSLLCAFTVVVVLPNQRWWRRPDDGFFACRGQLQNVGTALTMYARDHAGRFPPDLDALVCDNYLKQLPACPGATRSLYSYRRTVGETVVFCSGDCHHATLER